MSRIGRTRKRWILARCFVYFGQSIITQPPYFVLFKVILYFLPLEINIEPPFGSRICFTFVPTTLSKYISMKTEVNSIEKGVKELHVGNIFLAFVCRHLRGTSQYPSESICKSDLGWITIFLATDHQYLMLPGYWASILVFCLFGTPGDDVCKSNLHNMVGWSPSTGMVMMRRMMMACLGIANTCGMFNSWKLLADMPGLGIPGTTNIHIQ